MSACLWLEMYWCSHFLAVWTSIAGQPAPSGQPPRHSNGAVTKPSSPGYLISCSFPHALIQALSPQMDLLRPHGRLVASRTQVRNLMPTEAGILLKAPALPPPCSIWQAFPGLRVKGPALGLSSGSSAPATLPPPHAH